MSFSGKIRISIAIGIVTAVIFSICSFAKTSEEIRSDVLRLHVIANSDSSVDQNLKLRLRDYILEEGEDIFDGSVNVENAVKKIEPKLADLENSAETFVKNAGFDYDVKITLSNEYFTTRLTSVSEMLRLFEHVLYVRLKIVEVLELREWLLMKRMFPPMCVPAADKKDEIENVFTDKEIKLVESKPKYEPRFKVVEIYEQIRETISERTGQAL